MAERFQRRTTFAQYQPMMGEARGLQTLSQRLQEFSMGQQDVLDVQAQAEATRAGTAAGMAGAPQLRRDSTISAEAFNKAAITSYATGVVLDAKEKVKSLEQQYKNDPLGFQTAFDASLKGTLEGIEAPEIRLIAEQKYREHGIAASGRIQETHREFLMGQAEATINRGLNSIENDVFDAIRNGDLNQATNLQDQYNGIMMGAVEAQMISPVEAEKRLHEHREAADVVAIVSGFSNELKDDGKPWEAIQKIATAKNLGISEDARKAAIKQMTDLHSDWDKHQRRLEAQEQAELEANQETNLSTLFDALYSGDFTPEQLRYQAGEFRSNKDIDEKGYRLFQKALRAGETHADDPMTEMHIDQLLFDPQGSLPQIQAEIFNAVTQGRLTPDTARAKMMELRSTPMRDVTRHPDWGLAIDMIRRVMQTTGPLAAFDTTEQQRINDATRDLRKYVLDGEQPFDVLDAIIEKHQKKARVGVGTPVVIGGEQTLEQKKTDLVRKVNSGEIDYNTYELEIEKINSQMEALGQ